MSNNSKHTQGKVSVNSACKTEVNTDNGIAIAECHMSTMISQEEKEANAKLITEAFNVTNESGLTPMELLEYNHLLTDMAKNHAKQMATSLEQRKELLERIAQLESEVEDNRYDAMERDEKSDL